MQRPCQAKDAGYLSIVMGRNAARLLERGVRALHARPAIAIARVHRVPTDGGGRLAEILWSVKRGCRDASTLSRSSVGPSYRLDAAREVAPVSS